MRIQGVQRATGIVLLGIGAAVVYGILQDQVTAHLCVEYFTIGHVDYLNLGNPTLIAFEWGIIATWWVGLILGIAVAIVARVGRRSALTARDLLLPTFVLMLGIGIVALIAGIIGFIAARAGAVYLIDPLYSEVPRARHVAFLTDLWAHDGAYAAGLLGGIILCAWIWRMRGRLPANAAPIGRRGGGGRTAPLAPHVATDYRVSAWIPLVLTLFQVIGAICLCLGGLFILAIAVLSSVGL